MPIDSGRLSLGISRAVIIGGFSLFLASCGGTPPPVEPVFPVEVNADPMDLRYGAAGMRVQPAPLGTGKDAKPETIQVAILLPLSGPRAGIGKSMLNAAQMAMFEIAGKQFALLPYDTLGTPEGARAAAIRAQEKGARLVLGPLLADSVKAVADQLQGSNINIVAFSNSRAVAGNGVYTMGFAPDQQVDAIIDYAASQQIARYALLAPSNGYGDIVAETMAAAAERLGVTVEKSEFYDPSATDFTEPARLVTDYDARHEELLKQKTELEGKEDAASKETLAQLEILDTVGDLPFDAIVLPDAGQNLRTLAALMTFYDIVQPEVRILGLRAWDGTPEVFADKALTGAWFTAPPVKDRYDFEKRYRGAFGKLPTRLASLAYDATALAAVLARSPETADFSTGALTNLNGFRGVDGIFRLGQDGMVERSYAIYEVTKGGFVTIRPAVMTFLPVPTS